MSGRVLPFIGSREPWSSGQKTRAATCLLAPNASAWTLDGTNTWFLHDPDSHAAVVVDPGPDHPGHLEAIVAYAHLLDAPVSTIVLTHGHVDHSEGAGRLRELTGADVRAFDPAHRLGAEGLVDGDVIVAGNLEVHVIESPGHSHDSVSLLLPSEGSLLTGDTVLGRGTSVVTWPDGDLRDYLRSLERLRAVVDVARLLPGHGPLLDRPGEIFDAYLEHRRVRLDEVREAVALGITDPAEVVARVYAQTPKELWPAAEQSVRAQLAYLSEA